MLSCKEASRLVSLSIDQRLSWRQRGALRLHLFLCAACTRFKQQAKFLHKAAEEFGRRSVQLGQHLRLTPNARERIKEALARARK
ncbi:MAG: zf-HC2 domain-containing protein [Gammaproteobacteria bacterium]|nr:zf-HC2 domain-containing protein [Gammaproteobacteria bacterium]